MTSLLKDYSVQEDNDVHPPKKSIVIFYDITDPTFIRTAKFYSFLFGSQEENVYPFAVSTLDSLLAPENPSSLLPPENLVVIYVGHGRNDGKPYPYLILGKDRKPVDFISYLKKARQEKESTLIIVDSCNSQPGDPMSRYEQLAVQRTLNLLLNLKGFNILCSSSRNNYSYYYPGNITLFYVALSNTLRDEISNLKDFLVHLDTTLKGYYNSINRSYVPDKGLIYFEIDEINEQGFTHSILDVSKTLKDSLEEIKNVDIDLKMENTKKRKTFDDEKKKINSKK